MRVTTIWIAALLFFLAGCDTARHVDPVFRDYFIKYYGTEGDQSGADLLVNDDGTMLLLGNSVSSSGSNTAFIVKVDEMGNVIWQRQIGAQNETAADVELIKNGPHRGNLIIATNVGPEATSRIRLLRLTQDGAAIDSAIVPLHVNGVKQCVKSITSLELNEGYVISGYADKTLTNDKAPITDATDQADILAFKLDETLTEVEMVSTKAGEHVGSGIKVFELAGDPERFAVFGYSDKPYEKNYIFNFTYEVTESGISSGIVGVAGTETEEQVLAMVIRTPPSVGEGFLLAGTSRSPGSPSGDIYLVKYNTSFDVKSLDQVLPLNRSLDCVAADNGPSASFYILANEMSQGELKDITLVKVGYDGVSHWIRSFGTREGDDTGVAVTSLPDGRIAIVGTMELQTKKKLALILLNNNGNLSK